MPRRRSAAIRALHGTLEDYLRALHERFADARPARAAASSLDCAQRRDLPRRARDLPPPRRRRRPRSPTRPTGATSTRAAARRTSTALAEHGARRRPRRSASPSTATATACSPSTATARSSTATSSIALAALHLRAAGRLPGDGVAVTVMTNYGFHAAMAEAGHRGRDHAGRRPLRARGAARARLGARRRAVRPHHRARLRALGRRHREPRCSTLEALDGRRPRASATRCASCPSGSSTCASPTATPRWATADVVGREREGGRRPGGPRAACWCRPSGTEPLVRVMVEAPTAEEADAVCARLVAVVERAAPPA